MILQEDRQDMENVPTGLLTKFSVFCGTNKDIRYCKENKCFQYTVSQRYLTKKLKEVKNS